MAGLGSSFRKARLQKGLEIEQVSRALYIRTSFLRALEEEQWDGLPEPPYARGLVKNYASYLGLDVAESLAEFERLAPAQHALEPLSQLDEPLVDHARSQRQSTTLFIALLAGIALIVSAWFAFSWFYLGNNPLEAFRAPGQTPAAPTATTAPALAPTANVTLLPTPGLVPTQRLAATPLPTVTSIVEPTDTLQASGVTVALAASAECWTQVNVDSQLVFAGTLQAGDELSYTAQSEIQLTLGNAGGIALTVNGSERGAPGASGQVVNLIFGPND